jgi:hypothetical protein
MATDRGEHQGPRPVRGSVRRAQPVRQGCGDGGRVTAGGCGNAGCSGSHAGGGRVAGARRAGAGGNKPCLAGADDHLLRRPGGGVGCRRPGPGGGAAPSRGQHGRERRGGARRPAAHGEEGVAAAFHGEAQGRGARDALPPDRLRAHVVICNCNSHARVRLCKCTENI